MAIRNRAKPSPPDQETRDLLQALIETPPVPVDQRWVPITLRSAHEQRRHALQGFLLRTWIDSLLRNAERVVVLAALLVFGYWLIDGPVRDWIHDWQTPAANASAARPTQAAATTQRLASEPPQRRAKLLPYVTSAMADPAPVDEFIAPRQGAIAAPIVGAPQPIRLLIPALELDTPVREVFVIDGAWEVADYAAGYLHGTGMPGEKGNAVLAGHAGLRGAVFRDLGSLVAGDDILIDAAGWRYRYRVRESKSVLPTQIDVLDPTPSATLTLMTCTNWDTQRLVVVADLVDSKPSPRS
jgi:sortase A